MVVVTIVRWDYKPTYNWGVPHTVELCSGTVVTVVPPGVKPWLKQHPLLRLGWARKQWGKCVDWWMGAEEGDKGQLNGHSTKHQPARMTQSWGSGWGFMWEAPPWNIPIFTMLQVGWFDEDYEDGDIYKKCEGWLAVGWKTCVAGDDCDDQDYYDDHRHHHQHIRIYHNDHHIRIEDVSYHHDMRIGNNINVL